MRGKATFGRVAHGLARGALRSGSVSPSSPSVPLTSPLSFLPSSVFTLVLYIIAAYRIHLFNLSCSCLLTAAASVRYPRRPNPIIPSINAPTHPFMRTPKSDSYRVRSLYNQLSFLRARSRARRASCASRLNTFLDASPQYHASLNICAGRVCLYSNALCECSMTFCFRTTHARCLRRLRMCSPQSSDHPCRVSIVACPSSAAHIYRC